MIFSIFKPYKNLRYGISQKRDGAMNIVWGASSETDKNRKKFFKNQQINIQKVVSAGLIHASKVQIVGNRQAGKLIPKTDGLITKHPHLALTITTADCFPVFIYDPKAKVIALLHCGWRGIVGNVIAKSLTQFKKSFKSKAADVLAGVGPGICANHFEVKSDVIGKFKSYSNFVIHKKEKFFVDLRGIIKSQLLKQGAKPSNIEFADDCTLLLRSKYFSFRRDRPSVPDTMVSFIVLI